MIKSEKTVKARQTDSVMGVLGERAERRVKKKKILIKRKVRSSTAREEPGTDRKQGERKPRGSTSSLLQSRRKEKK